MLKRFDGWAARIVACLTILSALYLGATSVIDARAGQIAKTQVDAAVADLRKSVDQIKAAQDQQAIAQTRAESDLATVKALQAESRQDIKAILREVQGR